MFSLKPFSFILVISISIFLYWESSVFIRGFLLSTFLCPLILFSTWQIIYVRYYVLLWYAPSSPKMREWEEPLWMTWMRQAAQDAMYKTRSLSRYSSGLSSCPLAEHPDKQGTAHQLSPQHRPHTALPPVLILQINHLAFNYTTDQDGTSARENQCQTPLSAPLMSPCILAQLGGNAGCLLLGTVTAI